jgi:hypothetical protein
MRTFFSRTLLVERGKVIEGVDPETVIKNYLYDVLRERVTENSESTRRYNDGGMVLRFEGLTLLILPFRIEASMSIYSFRI